jgi:hypothetical protein
MSVDPTATLPELEATLAALSQAHFGGAAPQAATLLAAEAGHGEYLLARIRCLEAALAAAADDVSWISPASRSTPAQSLRRIRTLCELFPDLFDALFVIAATHSTVSREMLAMAIKQFRSDTESLSQDDLVGLLVSVMNGGNQAFEAVLRTRKGSGRKATSLPWGKDTD